MNGSARHRDGAARRSGTTPRAREAGDAEHAAAKRALAAQIEKEMRRLRLGKGELADRLGTSRSAVDRLLDPERGSVTLRTLTKVGAVLGMRLLARFSGGRDRQRAAH